MPASPGRAVVERDVQPGLGPDVQHAGGTGVGPNHPHEVVGRDGQSPVIAIAIAVVLAVVGRAGDRLPALSVVGGLVEIGRVVIELVAGGGEVQSGGVVRRGFDGADERPLRQVRRGHVAPASPPVAAQVHQAVVRPRPEHARLVGRFGEGGQGAVVLGPARVAGDGAAGGAELVRGRAGQVGAHRLPVLSLVDGAEQPVAAGVEHVRVVRREPDREGPPEPVPELTRPHSAVVFGPHVDEPHLPGAMIVALQGAASARRAADGADKEDIRVLRVHRHVAALPGAGDAAVLPGDGTVVGAGRHPDAGVVLLGAVDEVVRGAAVGVHGIELRGELVVDGAPRGAGVERDVGAAVVALDHPPVVARVDPQIVVVSVRSGHLIEVRAGVGRLPHPQVVDVDGVLILRIRKDVHVVPGAVAQILARARKRPGLAEVVRAVEAGRRVGFDQRPHPPGSGGRGGDADLAQCGRSGQTETRGDFGPGRSGVGRAPQAASRATAPELPEVAVRPPEACVEHRGVAGVEGEVGRSGGIVPVKHPFPVRASIGGAVHAALRVGAEGVSERGHPDPIGVARVDTDLADVPGVGESEVGPGPAPVGGSVHAVAVGDIGADGALAHARVDHAGVGVGHRKRAHRRGLQVPVAHVRPGDPGVLGLPDAAGYRAEPEHCGVGRIAGHRHHPAASRRADAAKPHGMEQRIERGISHRRISGSGRRARHGGSVVG